MQCKTGSSVPFWCRVRPTQSSFRTPLPPGGSIRPAIYVNVASFSNVQACRNRQSEQQRNTLSQKPARHGSARHGCQTILRQGLAQHGAALKLPAFRDDAQQLNAHSVEHSSRSNTGACLPKHSGVKRLMTRRSISWGWPSAIRRSATMRRPAKQRGRASAPAARGNRQRRPLQRRGPSLRRCQRG